VASLRAQFAENFRAIRDYTGLTRDQFCEVIGIELSTLISIERADHAPSFDMLEQFAIRMKIQAWELFRFDPGFTSELKQRINRNLTTSNG
jgi:transcriptional regulator with XRE-family HTH domain